MKDTKVFAGLLELSIMMMMTCSAGLGCSVLDTPIPVEDSTPEHLHCSCGNDPF